MASFLRKAGSVGIFLLAAGGALLSLAADQSIEFQPPPVISQPDESADAPIPPDGAAHFVSDQSLTSGESLAGGDGCDCDIDMCTCCPPIWYASAGVVILKRSTPAPGIVVAANPGGAEFSNADDFNFRFQSGIDVTLARRMRNGDILEGRYFGLVSQDNNQFVTPGGFIGAGFTGPGGTNFFGTYITRLDSAELNWRRAWNNQLTLLAGFRTILLNDDMTYKLNGNVATGQYQFNNYLYGAQIGADWALTDRTNPFQLNIVGKAGYYGNLADGGIFEFSGNNFIGSFTARETVGAFVGDIGISGAYRLTNCMAIRAGYQLLWIDNVALGSDAASISLVNPSLLRSIHTGDLFYHGATVALDIVW